MGTLQSKYIAQLKAQTLRQREEEALAKRPPKDPRISGNWEPLSIQIEKIMLSLPPVLKVGPFSLEFFQSKICAKYKPSASASAGDLGIALTALGFTRKRDYSNNGNGRRYWMPPPND